MLGLLALNVQVSHGRKLAVNFGYLCFFSLSLFRPERDSKPVGACRRYLLETEERLDATGLLLEVEEGAAATRPVAVLSQVLLPRRT